MKKILPLLMLFMLMLAINLCFAQATPGTAENFAVNSTANSTIGGANSNHWYKLVTTGDGNITLSAIASQTNGNTYTYIYLYDSDATSQLGTAGGYASNGGASFTAYGLAKGTYYCLINSSDGFSNSYSITNALALSPTNNDAEVNDYFIQSLTINQDDSAKGHIGYRNNGGTYDESDIYKLVITTDANVNISYTGDFANPGGSGGGSGYTYIYLYDKDTTTLLGTSGGYVSNGGASFTVNGLAAGTYYAKIAWGGSSGYFTGYTFKNVITSALTVNDIELNDYFIQSLIINANDSATGHIGYRRNGGSYDESDFYKLITNADGNITISYTGDLSNPSGSGGGNGYAYIYLYDKDTTTQLGTSGGYVSNGGASFTVNGLAAGTYYAKIAWGGSGGYFTGYKLKCKLDAAAYVNDVESNNTVATASLLNLNPNKSGHIGYRFNGGIYDTDDYWKIVMNTNDSMRVVLDFNGNGNPNAYVSVYLYNEAANQLFLQSAYVSNQSNYNIYFPTLAAGNYYLRIVWGGTSAYYCSYTIPVLHVPCNTIAAVITAGGPTTFCQGGSVALNTTPTFTAYGQSNGYTGYLWSNTATTQNITVNSSGSYSVEAKDEDGCPHVSNIIPVTVNPIPATPTIQAGGATTFCAGGSVTLTSSAATGNTWSNGATTQSITVNTSGNYTVSVTANGCTSNASVATAVTVNPLPTTPTISAGGATTFCAGGSVTLTSSTATSYLWSNGATTQSITVSANGSYSVVVKNANGCSSAASATTTVTVNPLPATPTISADGPTTFCQGGRVILTSSSAIGNLWSTGATTQSINVTTGGSYSVTITNGNGCSATSAATTVTVNPLPIVTLGSFNSVCVTDAAFILNGGSPAGGTYSGTGVSAGQFNPATAGVGAFTITYSYTNGNGCTATATQSIAVTNCGGCTPTVSAGGSTTFCQGGSVTLTSSAASSYLWSNGATTQSINVNTGGNYSVTTTNATGCTATSSAVVVTVNPLQATPTISAGGPTTFCAGGSVTLTSSVATSYLWSNGATTQSITVNASGSFSVTATNTGGCSATSAATIITVNPLPATPTISTGGSSTTFCAGGSITLTSNAATGNLWSNGATTQSITVSTGGSYSVTVTNGNGCSATSAATTVTVNPLPTVSLASFAQSCTTDPAFTLTGGSPVGGTYNGTGVSNNQFNPAVAGVGTFTITYSYTNANGCTATATNTITVTTCGGGCSASITADKPTTFCQGGSVMLTASAGASYLWSNAATTQSIIVTTGGSYTVTVTSASGCTATSAATVVTVNPLPAVPTITANGSTTICAGSSVTLTSNAASSYLWNNGATTQSITVSAAGSYNVTVKNASGCSNTSASTTVTVNALPDAPTVTAGGPTTFCQGGSVILTSSAASSYLWSNGVTSQSITVSSSGNYSVTVKNASGCSRTSAAITVTVNNCGGTYCTANGTSKNKGYIANVYFKNIFNTTGWSNGGYGNYLNQSASVNKGGLYIISVAPGFPSLFAINGMYTRVWIDWNQDGDFDDAGELAFAPSGQSIFLRLGVVYVPLNAKNGSTRMRVAMKADGYPSSCGSFTYGEVEDYTIVVGGSTGSRNIQPTEDEQITLRESFNLYPNPVSEELVIQRLSNDNSKAVATNTAMQIIDMNGRVVLKANLTRSTEVIDVRRLPAGMYIVQLKSDKGITTKKIVVTH